MFLKIAHYVGLERSTKRRDDKKASTVQRKNAHHSKPHDQRGQPPTEKRWEHSEDQNDIKIGKAGPQERHKRPNEAKGQERREKSERQQRKQKSQKLFVQFFLKRTVIVMMKMGINFKSKFLSR